MKTCSAPNCNNFVFAKKLCSRHQYLRTDKKQKRIAPISPKRIESNKLYTARAALFIATHKKCAINSPECTQIAQHVHHVRGRIGPLLMDQQYWLPSCDRCNLYIETHDAWARENNFKQSKFITPE